MKAHNITEESVKERKKWGDYQNNTNISLVNEYVYFAVDKVANSTVKQFLFSKEYAPVNKSILSLYDPRCTPLLSPYQLPHTPNELFAELELFKFAFVRNPYTRLLSCYLDRVLTQTSKPSREFRSKIKKHDFDFHDFVCFVCGQSSKEQNSHWRLQADDILFELIDFDFIGKFERLGKDLSVVSEKVFKEALDDSVLKGNFSPKRTSANDKLVEFYTQDLLNRVYDSHRKDFEFFGYDKIVL